MDGGWGEVGEVWCSGGCRSYDAAYTYRDVVTYGSRSDGNVRRSDRVR